MSNPIKIQFYVEAMISLHQRVVETYTRELSKDMNMNLSNKHKFMALIIELSNNLQLLQQI